MTRNSAAAMLPFLLLCLDLATAVKFNIHGRSDRWDAPAVVQSRSHLLNRGSITTNGSDDLTNGDDISYYADLILGGKNFSVLIDTGSSDLWVGSSVPNSKNTGKNAVVNYASGSASGAVYTADLDFLGYEVQDQAFILATGKTAGKGLIGLGPNVGSQVHDALNSNTGNTVLDRIFIQNTTTPNILTILLARSDDPTDRWPGEITIGETVDGFTNVTDQPQLPVTEVAMNDQGNQHWQIKLDQDGIIGPDGKPINASSIVDGSNVLTAVLDSGFSLPQVPRAIADAIYSRIPGASFQNVTRGVGKAWTIPCTAEVNVTFKIGGVSYPIHPLDSSIDWDNNLCIGSFQPKTVESNTYDMILGMAFLRNAYMLVNFGDFVDGKSGKVADPYIQLLSLTDDATEAHNDFVNVRLNGVDTTGGQTLLSTVTSSGPPDPTYNGSGGDSNFVKWFKKNKWILIGVAIGIVSILSIMSLALCLCRRGGKKKWMKGVPVQNSSYRQLNEPAPRGDEHYEYRPRPSTGQY